MEKGEGGIGGELTGEGLGGRKRRKIRRREERGGE